MLVKIVHAIASELVSGVESFTIDSMIRVYHVYKYICSVQFYWRSALHCRRDMRNHHNPFLRQGDDGSGIHAQETNICSLLCFS